MIYYRAILWRRPVVLLSLKPAIESSADVGLKSDFSVEKPVTSLQSAKLGQALCKALFRGYVGCFRFFSAAVRKKHT